VKTRVRAAAALCLFLALLGVLPASLLPLPGSADRDARARAGQLEELQEELERTRRLIEEKQAEFERLQSQERSVTGELARIGRELDILQGELSDLESRIARTEESIDETAAEIADAQARLDVRTDLMLRRVRALAEVGYVHYLEVLLGSRSFADFLGRFEFLRQILVADVELFDQINEEKRQLEQKKAYLEEQRSELVALRAETSARRAAIAQRKQASERILNDIRRSKEATAQALDELEEMSERLARLIVEIQRARQQSGEIPLFAWPLDGRIIITSGFGMRYHPILKEWRPHHGIDLAAPMGTPVKASAAGTVILASWAGGYGRCIIIDHGGYASTLYAHLSGYRVSINDFVAQGAVIGYVGSTGYSTGPHLHFEIRLHGEPKDPLDFLPQR